MVAFESERVFRLWSFSMSHNMMLLRSNPESRSGFGSRIEISSGNVSALCIQPMMRGLKIWRPTREEAIEVVDRFGLEVQLEHLYLLSSGKLGGGEFRGFISGGRPQWREAVRELDDPTLFDWDQDWPPGPEVRWGNVD
jgi:hypothetical protein